ncbi:hypothetical protein [Streptomyces sp. NPDC002159]
MKTKMWNYAALYRDGVRVSSPAILADTCRELREEHDSMVWIGRPRPPRGVRTPLPGRAW